MDDLALASGLTQEDRAERVRDLWEQYRRLYGGEICDVMADLAHLAEVEDGPGGGADALYSADLHFNAESPDEDDDEAEAA